MINARASLFAFLRAFVEQRLCGLMTWNAVRADKPILAETEPSGRRNRIGKFKEVATIRFGDYVLTAKSPQSDPPLGWMTLESPDGVDEGPLDESTFDLMEAVIRNRGMKAFAHGNRRQDSSGWLPGPG